MKRDKSIFTDKEKHRVATDIVESAKKTKIKLKYTPRSEGYTYTHDNPEYNQKDVSGNIHDITIGKIDGVEQFTLLNHELGHVMFDSPLESGKRMINKWVESYDVESDIKTQIFKTYWSALNLIEDQRIEYLMGKLWLKNQVRFQKSKLNVGNELYNDIENSEDLKYNPIHCLQAVRFFKGSLVKDNKAYKLIKKILEDIEGTGPKGSLVALRMLKEYLDVFINSKIDECDKISDNLNNEYKNQETHINHDPNDSLESDNRELQINKLIEKLYNKVTDFNDKIDISKHGTQRFKEEGHDLEGKIEDVKAYAGDNSIDEDGEIGDKVTKESLKEQMEDAKEQGKKQFADVKEAVENGSNECSASGTNNMNVRSGSGTGIPLTEIAVGMNKLFRKMCELPKDCINDVGDEVDVESFITGKIDNNDITECLIDTKYTSGASILVSVDGSCSMDDGDKSMEQAKDMVATMFKSIIGINGIELKALVWSSNKKGEMNVTKINSLAETTFMTVREGWCLTPTHLAIKYSTDAIKKMKGRKKLLIIITDGYPQYYDNNKRVSVNVLIKLGKRAMVKGLRKCPNIMTMLINPSYYAKDSCKQIFGKRLMTVDDMEEGSEFIVNKFKRLVMDVLR